MASALIVLFLSCWLAGQSGVSERLARSLPASRLPNNGERRSPMTDDAVDVQEPSYPKPKISLHPSGQVTLGGAVTIQCECWCRGARFLLSKAGEQDTQCSTDLVRDVAEFPICSVSQGDAGSYSCRYSTKWDPPIWSEPSDPVELVIADAGSIPTGGNNDTQLETEAAPTRSGSTGPEGTDPAGPQQPEPPTTEPEGEGRSEQKLSIPIITGVSASAAGLLLLLVAFLCYRRTRGRSPSLQPQSMPSGVKGRSWMSCPGSPTPSPRDSPTPSWTARHCRPSGGARPLPPSPSCTPPSMSARSPMGRAPRVQGSPPPTRIV
ncbi:leukocyte immunoglobulin-like receptor subfamily B member 2 isoform X2 [Mauremys reevesii]|uniref:leukocyte immunoglobulin-like receptor subfamily B member 2 isoform X2 n=1 Tax=Mauremys reevesii TaxID=260615 RepID=UPI00193FF4B0|nr:leukocyte immunoglobulin-like receptor subfamily B member 2 isoform X2 [Mauremys reevesii]